MLKNTKLEIGSMTDELLSIKLISGEEIIAKLVNATNNDAILIHKPCILVPNPPGVGLAPAFMIPDFEDNVVLYRNGIVGFALASEEFASAYKDANSVITVPDKKIIL